MLGITSYYRDNPPDTEWAYLMKYGYSSVQAVQYIKVHFPNRSFMQKEIKSFEFQGKMINGKGIGCGIYQRETLIGRVTLLEKDRCINSGDYQVLRIVTDCFRASVRGKEGAEGSIYENAVFTRLLKGESAETETVRRQLSYYGWEPDDRYQVILARALKEPATEQIQDLVRTVMENAFPAGHVLKLDQDIVVIWNLSREEEIMAEKLESLVKRAEISVSRSLPLKGIHNLLYLHRQAQACFSLQQWEQMPGKNIAEFYDLAMDFIILSESLDGIYRACHPDVIMLWEREQKYQDELFHTFAAYINHDCSIKNTCEAIFMHRNMLIYRVRKLMKLIQSDISDSYTRSYMRLSVRALRLYQNRMLMHTQT